MAAWRRPRSGPASRADPSSSSPTPSSTSQASASGPRLLPRPPSPGSPAAPSSPLSPPLLELVSWATALCVSDLQQQQQQPPHMQLQPPASSSVSAAPAPLSFGWFRAVWLRSGCRLLPLLALSMQSQRSLLHSSAWGPSHDAVALTSSPLYRSCSFPSAVTRPLLLSAYDSLTHLLSQHCPLLQRALVYYALYTLHRTQLTVEKYPIPCTRHAWSTIRADVQLLSSLPVADCAAVLRAMLEDGMLVWVCAYPCRVLKEDLSDFQRRRVSSRVASTAGRATQGGRGGGGGGREGSGQGGGGVRGAIAPPAAAPIVGLQRVRQRRRWTTKLRSAPLSPLLSPSAANAAVVAQLVTAESEDSSSRHAHRADEHREEEDEEDDGEDREDRQAEEGAERECRQARDYAGSAEGGEVAAGSAESGRYARIQRQAQQRFERLAQHMAKQAADRRGRGGAADDVEQRTDDPLHLLLSPHPTTPPPSPPPPSSPRGVLGCSSPRLSAWLSSGRPLPLRSPLDASWQREVEGEAAAAEAAGASSLWRLLSAQLQEHHGGRAEPQSLMFGSLSALSAAYEVELSRLQAEAEGAGGGGERGGECDHPPSPPFTSSPSSATAAPATPPSSSPWLAHLSVGAQSLQQLTASHAHPPAASAAPPSSSAQASSPSPSPAFWQWSGERSSRRPSPPLPPLLQLLHGLDVAYHSSQQRQHSSFAEFLASPRRRAEEAASYDGAHLEGEKPQRAEQGECGQGEGDDEEKRGGRAAVDVGEEGGDAAEGRSPASDVDWAVAAPPAPEPPSTTTSPQPSPSPAGPPLPLPSAAPPPVTAPLSSTAITSDASAAPPSLDPSSASEREGGSGRRRRQQPTPQQPSPPAQPPSSERQRKTGRKRQKLSHSEPRGGGETVGGGETAPVSLQSVRSQQLQLEEEARQVLQGSGRRRQRTAQSNAHLR